MGKRDFAPGAGRVASTRRVGDTTSTLENGIHGSSQRVVPSMLTPVWLTTRLGELPRGELHGEVGKGARHERRPRYR
jgi:hypothetical protein